MADTREAILNVDQVGRIAKQVKRLEAIPLNTPPIQRQFTPLPGLLWAILTDESAGAYKWKAQVFAGGAWTDAVPSLTSGTFYSAVEANRVAGLVGNRVPLTFNGVDVDGNAVYLFSAGEGPIGMYPGMVYQVTAANTGGWDWEHAHSIL